MLLRLERTVVTTFRSVVANETVPLPSTSAALTSLNGSGLNSEPVRSR